MKAAPRLVKVGELPASVERPVLQPRTSDSVSA